MSWILVLCRAFLKVYNYILLPCSTKIGVNFVSTGTLLVSFTIMSVVPRIVPDIYWANTQ